MSLFRAEVGRAQRKRLYGSVSINQPPSVVAFAFVTASMAVAAGAVLFGSSFGLEATATGWLTPEGGFSEIFSSKTAVVRSIGPQVGDRVVAGQILATLSADVSGPNGGLAPIQRRALQDRVAEIDTQILTENLRQDNELKRLQLRAAAAKVEARRLLAEQAFGQQQLAIAQRQYEAIQPLIAQGYIAGEGRERRLQLVVAAQQSLSAMTRQLEAKLAEAEDYETQAAGIAQSRTIAISQLRASRASLAEELTGIDLNDGLTIRSPVDGQVAAVNVHVGDTTAIDAPAFVIAPKGSKLQATVLIPTRSAGFVLPGQAVRLSVDAFPAQRYGQFSGRVKAISRAPTTPTALGMPFDIQEPVYPAVIDLTAAAPSKHDLSYRLQPGMTLRASITTQRRSFLQWIFGEDERAR